MDTYNKQTPPPLINIRRILPCSLSQAFLPVYLSYIKKRGLKTLLELNVRAGNGAVNKPTVSKLFSNGGIFHAERRFLPSCPWEHVL